MSLVSFPSWGATLKCAGMISWESGQTRSQDLQIMIAPHQAKINGVGFSADKPYASKEMKVDRSYSFTEDIVTGRLFSLVQPSMLGIYEFWFYPETGELKYKSMESGTDTDHEFVYRADCR